jgi:hypothetical protein
MKRILLSLIAVVATIAGPILAQDQQGPQDPNDQQQQQEPDGQYEQGRGVARISVLNGDVSVRRGDSGDVVAAALNAPLMANDSLLTGSSSRAEVQLDWANLLRIGPNSEVRFTGLDVKSFQIQIAAGTVIYRVLRPSQAQAELDTPSVAVHALGQGIYRISVRDDGTSEITVRNGEAEIFSPHGSERLGPGRTMYARGQASDPEFQVAGAIAPDSWDQWNNERDQYLLRSRSYEHVSRDVSGAEDLDQYGQWTNDPSYGQVWQPTVAPGWAPYRDGRWVWEDYYGWTWVSSDPWGWAPYHYGRWFYGGSGWCWYPGNAFGHYGWSPALVGFFGFGGHVGFGFGFGGLGWVPLAPFERFHPWWGRGFYGGFRNGGFARNTTIVNNANISNMYRNARVNGGVTGVNANQFGRGGAQHQTLSHAQIQQAGLVRGAVPVAPGRSSLQMSNRASTGNFPQSRAQNFASHTQAAQVDHVPFAQQQRGMQQMSRSDFSSTGRSAAGNSSVGRTASPNTFAAPSRGASSAGGNGSSASGSSASGHGWNRFGEPIHGASGASSSQSSGGGSSRTPSNSGSGGWQRLENTRPSGGSNGGSLSRGYSGTQGYSGGSGQAIRISPSIVQQRSPSYQSPRSYSPSYQAPRSSSPSYQAPRGSSGGSAPRSSGGGGASRGSSGGGGHASGGGHGGGGHR